MIPSFQKAVPAVSAALFITFAFTGCETAGDSALLGAATGAAVGGLATGRGRGALTGAAIGAGAGYLIGRVAESERRDSYSRYERDRDDDDDDYREERTYRRSSGPVGRRTGRRGFVESPYAPYNLIDVRGIPSGARVVDPSVDRVFVNP